ncbi:MAG: cell division protein CrgA [Acidimicrobiales bacterium]
MKRRIEGGSGSTTTGRTTPKGTKPGEAPSSSGPVASSRYTPPTPATKYDMPSPTWVPVLMFSFFGAGLLAIFLNYTEVLPSSPSQWYLLGGLTAILLGIVTATQLR